MGYNSAIELRKYVAPEIIEGLNARLLIGRYMEHYRARKPMIVTDKGVSELGWFAEIIDCISAKTPDYVIFDEITPNPKDHEAMKGAEQFISQDCDLIIAIGGGSPMDCAKCISIVSTNGGHILDYEGVDEVILPGPPLICIPTTSGTSADVSQFAIILDTETSIKKAIISKKVVPDLALIDPVPLMDMDQYLTACTGMDALTHAIEAYVSNAQSALTDVHALEAISLITDNLEAAVAPDRDIDTMFRMMLGSLHAGLAFSNASLGAVHAMAHSLGGLHDLPHGECNSILLEHIVALNFDSIPERYRTIAIKMGVLAEKLTDGEVKEKLTGRIRSLRESVGIPSHIFVDCFEDQLNKLTESALNDPCMVTNPRKLTPEEVKNIYERIIRCKS
ncbi:MAG: alcohol dehydrogenase-like regulatory protein ErcA [Pseudomonadota bacterium]